MSHVSTTQFSGTWENRIRSFSDRFNPLVVREIRQVVKARSFMTVFSLLLIGSWAYSVFGVIKQFEQMEYTELGPLFYRVYLVALIGCLMFAIPSNAFFSMAQEFHDRAFEMLAVTTLSPAKIVSGKLQGAVVMMFVYASAVAPFICLSYMLGGLGLIEIITSLCGLMLVAIALTMFAVMMGALSQKPWLEVMNLIILLVVAMVTAGTSYSVLIEVVLRSGVELGGAIMGIGCFVVFMVFVALISLGVAQAQLTTTFLPIGYRRNPNVQHPNSVPPQTTDQPRTSLQQEITQEDLEL
ncbi:ABC transporter permease [Planctomycetaceae bacterium]|nr:ABC transporter permease [Planctomycetaceae bacterium]MDC0261980.1 ABC transporter permease [Planctomycetaceae bacterium]MDC0273908.1 ABC transporter permease [Planctomycetaceae bacterium]